jgi:hypothetical protein
MTVDMGSPMAARLQHSPTGVCVIRIEVQSRGILITLRINPDAEQVSTERVRRVVDIETAVQIVSDFLDTFASGSTAEGDHPG